MRRPTGAPDRSNGETCRRRRVRRGGSPKQNISLPPGMANIPCCPRLPRVTSALSLQPLVQRIMMMKPIHRPKTSLVVKLDPPRELARAVLAQAVSDACSLTIDERQRLDAAAFLLDGDEVLSFWCAVGGLDPDDVRDYARLLFDSPQEFELLPTQGAS